MSVVNGLDGLLKGKEKIALDNVKVQLMQKGESNSQEIAKSVTQLLHMISLNGNNTPVANSINIEQSMEAVEAEFSESGEKILDGELIEIGGPDE